MPYEKQITIAECLTFSISTSPFITTCDSIKLACRQVRCGAKTQSSNWLSRYFYAAQVRRVSSPIDHSDSFNVLSAESTQFN